MPARGSSLFVRLLLVVAAFLLSHSPAAHSQDNCANRIGRIVSLQGEVQVQRARTVEWVSLKGLDVPLCIGDQIRTGLLSRAGLYISPETIVRLDQNTTLEFVEQTPEQTVVALRREEFNRVIEKRAGQCGVGYFITRFPRKLKVRTPFYNAVVEGTEFQVAMSCDRGELAVFEGKVAAEKLDAPSERVLVEGGQSTSVGTGETPAGIKALVRPADAVQWALYYLPLSDVKGLTEDALAQDCAAVSPELRSGCAIRKAEYLLKVGRVAEARGQLEALSAAEPNNGDVLALQSIIALVQSDKGQALTLAQRATQAAPKAFRSYAALSYARQAHFKLEEALSAAQRAAQLAPTSALMKARAAELQLSLGKTRAAERDAKEAVGLDPNESRAHLILGFVHLAQIDTKAAKVDFGRAIELDSTEPLARLGLGLATIREGKLQEGREQIEIAVALDPTNSLVRSYVGKAYYEEHSKARDQLAATQFGLAKSLDPKDPTPWFYDAILKQTQNKPVEALQDLRQSIALNDNRAVYRSKLALDDDVASRLTGRSRVYNDLGFERLAVLESAAALAQSPTNGAAHRLLAYSYLNLLRHDIARSSEYLVAQVWQPISVPVSTPQAAQQDFILSRETGMTLGGGNEYTNLFERDQFRVKLDGTVGELGTSSTHAVISGLSGPFAYSLSNLHYQSQGFGPDDDTKNNSLGLFLAGQISPAAQLQLDVRKQSFDLHRTFFPFDPIFVLPTAIQEKNSGLRVNGHVTTERGGWVATAAYQERERVDIYTPLAVLITETHAATSAVELQHVHQRDSYWVLGGVSYTMEEDIFPIEQASINTTVRTAYVYAHSRVDSNPLDLYYGASYDDFILENTLYENRIDRSSLNPKIGLSYQFPFGTTVRAASLKSVKRPLIYGEMLEPTQVVGFNQFFTGFERLYGDVDGTVSRRTVAAVDHKLSDTAFTGLEYGKRRLAVPSLNLREDFVWKEETLSAYLYNAVPHSVLVSVLRGFDLGLSLEIERERLRRPQILTGSEGIVEMTTTRIPLGVALSSDGLSLRLNVSYIRQQGILSADTQADRFPKEEAGWVADLALQFSLPKRLGVLTFGARNLFNSHIDLFESDPVNPRVAGRRLLFARASLTL